MALKQTINRDSALREEISAHLDLSVQRIRSLIRQDVLSKSGSLDEYRIAYIRWLRGKAHVSGAGPSGPGSMNLTQERARLTRAQSEKTEIEVAYLRGDSLPRTLITETWQMHAAAVRSRFLGLTSKLKMLIPRLTAEEGEIVDREVREILEELSGDGLPPEAKAAAVRYMRKYGKRH
jgi:phage terminase Nu1 subunit (DNA packaging protein)